MLDRGQDGLLLYPEDVEQGGGDIRLGGEAEDIDCLTACQFYWRTKHVDVFHGSHKPNKVLLYLSLGGFSAGVIGMLAFAFTASVIAVSVGAAFLVMGVEALLIYLASSVTLASVSEGEYLRLTRISPCFCGGRRTLLGPMGAIDSVFTLVSPAHTLDPTVPPRASFARLNARVRVGAGFSSPIGRPVGVGMWEVDMREVPFGDWEVSLQATMSKDGRAPTPLASAAHLLRQLIGEARGREVSGGPSPVTPLPFPADLQRATKAEWLGAEEERAEMEEMEQDMERGGGSVMFPFGRKRTWLQRNVASVFLLCVPPFQILLVAIFAIARQNLTLGIAAIGMGLVFGPMLYFVNRILLNSDDRSDSLVRVDAAGVSIRLQGNNNRSSRTFRIEPLAAVASVSNVKRVRVVSDSESESCQVYFDPSLLFYPPADAEMPVTFQSLPSGVVAIPLWAPRLAGGKPGIVLRTGMGGSIPCLLPVRPTPKAIESLTNDVRLQCAAHGRPVPADPFDVPYTIPHEPHHLPPAPPPPEHQHPEEKGEPQHHFPQLDPGDIAL